MNGGRGGKKWLQSIACVVIFHSCLIGSLSFTHGFHISAADALETWALKGYAVGKANGTELAGVSMAEVIRLDDGTYRMYYGTVLGGGLNGIRYADSADCETWTAKGTAVEGTSGTSDPEYVINGASILRLPDGRYRMYYQSAPLAESGTPLLHVRSAISSDGKTFTKEGVRINISNYDSTSLLSLAGHGTYFYAADGTTVVGILCANFASNPNAPSDLVMVTSSDGGLTFGNYTTLYVKWHDPIVLKAGGKYRLYATYLVGEPAPYQGIAISSNGLTWPSSMTEVSLVDASNNPLTEADSGVGDIGGVVLTSGSSRLFTNYSSGGSSNIVYYDKQSSLTYALTVAKSGSGSGAITSSPSGIDCGSTCSASYDEGTPVTLTAAAATGSTFTGWAGCDSTSGSKHSARDKRKAASAATCTVTMTADKSVTATFTLDTETLSVTKTGTGSGTLSATGLTCSGNSCSGTYSYGTSVTISAAPDTGSTLTSFTGCGSTSGNTCTVAMTSNRSVTATFTSVCTYTIAPSTKSFPYKGGNVNVAVKAKGAKSCVGPTASVSDTWIGASVGSFKNNRGSIKIAASANGTVTSRTGTVTIMGNTFDVTQAGSPCSLTSISPVNVTLSSAGGPGSFSVTATTGCPWSAEVASAAAPWLSLSGATGSGSGSVGYICSQNTTRKQRNGKITVYLTQTPAKKKVFTLTEKK